MNTDRSVKVKDIVEKFQMEVLYPGADFETETLTITDVNRPGLQFVGFFDYFDPRRLQIIGKAETMFLKSFSSAERRKCFEDLFKYEIPALVISRKLDVFPECMEMAQKYGRTLLRTEHTSVEFTSMTIDFLNHELAPMITRHGVLMDVYGEGVLILGDSGIGKSETAIELIKRGHRLVADDAVEIRRIGDTLTGTAPELIRHYLEVRGGHSEALRHERRKVRDADRPGHSVRALAGRKVLRPARPRRSAHADHGCAHPAFDHSGLGGPQPRRYRGAGGDEQPPEEVRHQLRPRVR